MMEGKGYHVGIESIETILRKPQGIAEALSFFRNAEDSSKRQRGVRERADTFPCCMNDEGRMNA